MVASGISVLIGYALGTAQILVIDWLRSRWAHARQLRLLRADLRRVSEFQRRFGLLIDQPPDSDTLPRPATLSRSFLETVAALDFWITDEHRDDNSQEALLGIADGFEALKEIHANTIKHLEALRKAGPDKTELREMMETVVDYSGEYDQEVDYIQFLVRDSLRDIERRLRAVAFWPQLRRLFTRLPAGANPPPLKRGDPRLKDGSAAP